MLLAEYDITDKVVFITGAGRGIGKGIAQVLAEAGADVAINALTPRYVEARRRKSPKPPGGVLSRSLLTSPGPMACSAQLIRSCKPLGGSMSWSTTWGTPSVNHSWRCQEGGCCDCPV